MAIERKLTSTDLRNSLGKTATLKDLKTYLANNVAGDMQRVIDAERLATVADPAAKAFHVSFSWG